MNLINFPKDKNTIQEEAAAWIIRMDNTDLTCDEQAQLQAWLQESVRHKIEFIELAKVWNKMDALAQLTEILPATSHQTPASSCSSTTPERSRWYYASAAAFLLLCCTLTFQFYQDNLPYQPLFAKAENYTTRIGEVRQLSLADGSSMVMNTNSRIEVSFTPAEHTILLREGEAHFSVAKDSQRPFVVYVGNGSVTATGTAFTVKYTDGIADVLVAEGKVNVLPVDNTRSSVKKPSLYQHKTDIQPLSAGEKVSFNTQKISTPSKVDTAMIERELSWQTGMLLFENTPLDQVIREVSRYTHTRIVIQDKELFDLPVAGYFKAGETSAMLDVLQISFGIKVTRMDENYIVLSKNDNFIND